MHFIWQEWWVITWRCVKKQTFEQHAQVSRSGWWTTRKINKHGINYQARTGKWNSLLQCRTIRFNYLISMCFHVCGRLRPHTDQISINIIPSFLSCMSVSSDHLYAAWAGLNTHTHTHHFKLQPSLEKRSNCRISYLKKCNYDGSHHDKNWVEYCPEDKRDRQTPHLCELIDVWEK